MIEPTELSLQVSAHLARDSRRALGLATSRSLLIEDPKHTSRCALFFSSQPSG